MIEHRRKDGRNTVMSVPMPGANVPFAMGILQSIAARLLLEWKQGQVQGVEPDFVQYGSKERETCYKQMHC